MDSLDKNVQEYQIQLGKGHIQKAYKGIMTFMARLKSNLETGYPDYFTSSLYFGYMDMTYFAFTPPSLKNQNLKIAIVYIHEQVRFEVWLGGSNRKVQAEVIGQLSQRNIGKYKLSQVSPGVDSIIESILVERPNFNDREALMVQIEQKTIQFTKDITKIMDV